MSKTPDSRGNRFGIAIFLSAAVVMAAASGTVAAKPDEASAEGVQGCRLVGKIEGSSGYGKNNGWQKIAKHAAIEHADRLGASHVVWEKSYPTGAYNGTVTGKAYQCS